MCHARVSEGYFTENTYGPGTVLYYDTSYRYLIAISKLRLGILTEQGEGSES